MTRPQTCTRGCGGRAKKQKRLVTDYGTPLTRAAALMPWKKRGRDTERGLDEANKLNAARGAAAVYRIPSDVSAGASSSIAAKNAPAGSAHASEPPSPPARTAPRRLKPAAAASWSPSLPSLLLAPAWSVAVPAWSWFGAAPACRLLGATVPGGGPEGRAPQPRASRACIPH